MLSAAQPSELRAWRLHSHRQRITWSLRTLAAFAAAAATEDKRGILHYPPQPDCPDLATVIAILLSSLLVLKVTCIAIMTSLPFALAHLCNIRNLVIRQGLAL